MGLFGTKRKQPVGIINDDGFTRFAEPTLDEATENMKDTAIEYIVSLSKADKDKFFEGAELIWQGYQGLDNVKTKHQKALQRNAKASDAPAEDDDLLDDFLSEELDKASDKAK